MSPDVIRLRRPRSQEVWRVRRTIAHFVEAADTSSIAMAPLRRRQGQGG